VKLQAPGPLVGSTAGGASSSESNQATEEAAITTPPRGNHQVVTELLQPPRPPSTSSSSRQRQDGPRMPFGGYQGLRLQAPSPRGARGGICCIQGGDHRGAGCPARCAEHRRQRPVQPPQPVGPPCRPQGRAKQQAHQSRIRSTAQPCHLLGQVEA